MNKQRPIITEEFEYDGVDYKLEFFEVKSKKQIPKLPFTQVYAVGNFNNKVPIVKYAKHKDNLPGGGIEPGETISEALEREMNEELNMSVKMWRPIGYQKNSGSNGKTDYQFRVYAELEKNGEFTHDPGGLVVGNELIDISILNSRIKWGELGRFFEKTLAKNYLDFSIGIACRNEEKTIYNCLKSIEKALAYSGKKPTIYICLNGCIDDTEKEITRFQQNTNLRTEVLKVKGDLIDAQRKIWNTSTIHPVIYIDADVIVSKNTFVKIIKPFENPEVVVSYSATKHEYQNENSLLSRIHKLYTAGKYLTSQSFFHGRIFMIRDWYFPTTDEVKKRAVQTERYLLKYGGGLKSDDIFLSSYIIDKYGQSAIQQVPVKLVKSNAVSNWKDYFQTYRRMVIEVEKINQWFPEWKELRKIRYRKTNWKKWAASKSSDKALWLVYITIETFWNCCISLELFLARHHLAQPRESWIQTKTTKRKLK
jgi:ADP-ribose pyrophosphatase YjhB (NUDIX family)